MRGPTDPSPNLVRIFCDMYCTGNLAWVLPSKCAEFKPSSRGEDIDKALVVYEGNMMVKSGTLLLEETCSIDTPILFNFAMDRRAVAMEMAFF